MIKIACDKCGAGGAVVFQPSSGRNLCSRHLAADIESRAKHTIRSHRWLKSGNRIGVVLSGDWNSAALLIFLKKLTSGRRDIRLSALVPDNPAGNDPASVLEFARRQGIPVCPISPGSAPPAGSPDSAAVAYTLDDIAREVLVRFLTGSSEQLIRPPPAKFRGIPLICPFIAIPTRELAMYWEFQKSREGIRYEPLPPVIPEEPLTCEADAMLGDYGRRHPATPYALLNLADTLSRGNTAGIIASRRAMAGCSTAPGGMD